MLRVLMAMGRHEALFRESGAGPSDACRVQHTSNAYPRDADLRGDLLISEVEIQVALVEANTGLIFSPDFLFK